MSSSLSNNVHCFNVTNVIVCDRSASELLAWLPQLDPRERQENIQTNITGLGFAQNIVPIDGNWPSNSEECSQDSATASYDSSNSNYSPLGTENDYTLPEASLSELTGTTSIPALSTCRGDTPAQATGYASAQTSSSLSHDPYYPQFPTIQELQQLAGGPWGQGFCLDPIVNSRVPSSPSPPGQPVHYHRERFTLANHSWPDPYRCVCGQRQVDLGRHLRTSKFHSHPKGPRCPESKCKFTSRFAREDNFKHHYKKQHGKTDEEADRVIKEWNSQSQY
ncbi:hypothetical protein HOY82DRAFT_620195 [Tuber indicum]|nr:hypothetical protein HOY82DRAFT_620195 [Tuber indicum]